MSNLALTPSGTDDVHSNEFTGRDSTDLHTSTDTFGGVACDQGPHMHAAHSSASGSSTAFSRAPMIQTGTARARGHIRTSGPSPRCRPNRARSCCHAAGQSGRRTAAVPLQRTVPESRPLGPAHGPFPHPCNNHAGTWSHPTIQ